MLWTEIYFSRQHAMLIYKSRGWDFQIYNAILRGHPLRKFIAHSARLQSNARSGFVVLQLFYNWTCSDNTKLSLKAFKFQRGACSANFVPPIFQSMGCALAVDWKSSRWQWWSNQTAQQPASQPRIIDVWSEFYQFYFWRLYPRLCHTCI